ncbi:homocysteine S-methyltransferase family protein [Halomonas sp. M20]|uniref:homocysteine S-methyltransferase family protein n=1 Tax=Halomonas sp. M20 TaxID=2763264 RepID=UPI001D0A8884|nr:homocysteine S-methyltransferase family protein [Halomonas sp. M20]
MKTSARYNSARERLQAGQTLVLDGGVSTELERRGISMSDELWSGRAILDHEDAIIDMHRAYIDAGADVITANTYASSRLMLEPAGLEDRVEEINRRSIEAALEARERAGTPQVLVAGAMSHMVPIAKGSYRATTPKPLPSQVMTAAFHELAEIHASAGADLLLLEMMSIPSRMSAMFDALSDTPLPVWCGMSAARDEQGGLYSWHERTTPFSDIVDLAARQHFDVLGIMHTSAELIAEALSIMRERHKGPLMAYPDSGYLEMPHWRFVDTVTPEHFAEFAREWQEEGAQIIGGCCGLGPEHIKAIVS